MGGQVKLCYSFGCLALSVMFSASSPTSSSMCFLFCRCLECGPFSKKGENDNEVEYNGISSLLKSPRIKSNEAEEGAS